MWLRYVLAPGLTDVPSEMEEIADFAAALGVVERAEVLPFHQMGRHKWRKLGMDYSLGTAEAPTAKAITAAIDIFKRAGLAAM
jgi:pyruvate formate lyase activating enzyme